MSLRAKRWFASATAVAALVSVVGCGTSNNSSGGSTSGSSNTSNTASNTASNSSSTSNTSNNSSSSSSSSKMQLTETGSSLLFPLFNGQWIPAYKSVAPNVSMTAAATGSGTGIAQSLKGTIDMGASDAYLADAQMKAHPGMLNIPMAISAQQIMYNVPGVKGHLKMSGPVLAAIYQGTIKYWDNSKIKAMNSGVNLPHKPIVPVRRSDGSGDTFLFTQFLSDTDSKWKNSVSYSTSVSWPSLSTEVGAKGNSGVVTALTKNKYSIGYVGISYLDQATKAGLGYFALKNKAGNYVLPTSTDIIAAASKGAQNVPKDERVSLIFEPGAKSYPIINFEYIIVKKTQKTAAKAKALKSFLSWAIDPSKGNSAQYMHPVHFQPLPKNIKPMSQAQINEISG